MKKEVKLRKNYFYIFGYWKKLLRSFVGMIVTKNRSYHRVVLKGRIQGFNKYQIRK